MATPSTKYPLVDQWGTNLPTSDPPKISDFLEQWKGAFFPGRIPELDIRLLALLAFSVPFVPGWGTTIFPFNQWICSLILAGLAFAGFFAPIRTFFGPLQFAYLEYHPSLLTINQKLPSWTLLALLASPFSTTACFCIMWALPVGWHFVHQKYRRQVRDVTDRANQARSRATVAANSAREYAAATNDFEKQILALVAATQRDAMLAQSLKITDFFDRAAASWAALGEFTEPARKTTSAAEKVEDCAQNVIDCEPPDEEGRAGALARMLLEQAQEAVESAKEVQHLAEVAQATIDRSETAQKQDKDARKAMQDDAKRATDAAKELVKVMPDLSATLFSAAEGVEDVKRLADLAETTAIDGDMESGLSFVVDAEGAADKVVVAMKALSAANDSTHQCLMWLLLAKK